MKARFLSSSHISRSQQPHTLILNQHHNTFPRAQKGLGTQAHSSLQEYALATLSPGVVHLGFGGASLIVHVLLGNLLSLTGLPSLKQVLHVLPGDILHSTCFACFWVYLWNENSMKTGVMFDTHSSISREY